MASVGASTPTLHITAGATVNVNASNYDPFTDSTTPTQHVQVINDASGSFNLTAGTSSLAGISGGGSTTVQGGAVLYSDYIYQGQLTIGAGSTVVINPISGSNVPSALSDLASFNTGAVSPLNPLSVAAQSDSNTTGAPVNSGLSLVPEPSTWILMVIGALCLLCRRKRN